LARCLIVGCGCRGRALARELIARGNAVRGTTRRESRLSAIEAVGAEAVLGDPDVVGTLVRAFDHVAVACLLLGSAHGSAAQLSALHGTRLDMLLARMLDTTVRGVVYEAAGTVDPALLLAGASLVRERCVESRIPYALLEAAPDDSAAWLGAAVEAAEAVLNRPAAPLDSRHTQNR
jgi:uncharacterized protein YbjT (DUF2867 family)